MKPTIIEIDTVLEMITCPELGIAEYKEEIEKEKRNGATHVIFNKDNDRTEISFQRKRID